MIGSSSVRIQLQGPPVAGLVGIVQHLLRRLHIQIHTASTAGLPGATPLTLANDFEAPSSTSAGAASSLKLELEFAAGVARGS